MNDMIGIDPKAPCSLRDLSDLLRLFSPSEGRFIANFPMFWQNQLHEHFRSLSDLEQSAVVEAIRNRLAHAILPTKVQYRPEMSWSENAVNLRSIVSKLVGPAGMPRNLVEPIDQVLRDLDSFPDASEALINRTPEAYVAAARPILMVSRKVVLVDRYFTLKYWSEVRGTWLPDRRRKVLVRMMQEAVKWKQVEAFEIYYSPKRTGFSLRSQEDEFEGIATETEAAHIAIRVNSLDPGDAKDEEHARYLFGLKSGLRFDHGFDVASDGSKNHVSWMGNSVLSVLLDKYT